jgi:hypothetical protein
MVSYISPSLANTASDRVLLVANARIL